MYITSASFGKSLFEAFELLAEQTNTLEDMVWSKDVITSKEELEQMVANAQAAEAKAAAK